MKNEKPQHTINASEAERQLLNVGNNFKEKTAKFVKLLWFRIKSLILWNDKNSFVSNNPQLTRLMEKKMTFKELEFLKNEMRDNRFEIIGRINAIKLNGSNTDNKLELNSLYDSLSQYDDLLLGIDVKLAEIGFKYEVSIKTALPDNYDNMSIYYHKKYISIGEELDNCKTIENIILFTRLLNLDKENDIIDIRQIPKK